MRRTVCALVLLAVALPVGATERIALVGGTLIDGYGGEPVDDSVLLVEDGRIVQVGTTATLHVPDGVRVVSTEGMSVLPGLWDMHVHLMLVGHSDYAHWDATYPKRLRSEIMPAAAKQLLHAGVTSARDLGAPLDDSIAVRDAQRRGEIEGPTLYVSGPFIQHEAYPGTEAFRWGVNGADDAKRKVRQLCDAGVDVVLHCNGVMEEMKGIVSKVKPLAGKSLERANRALAAITMRDVEQEQLVRAEFATYFEAVA